MINERIVALFGRLNWCLSGVNSILPAALQQSLRRGLDAGMVEDLMGV